MTNCCYKRCFVPTTNPENTRLGSVGCPGWRRAEWETAVSCGCPDWEDGSVFGILASAGGPGGLMLVGPPTLQRAALLSLRRTDKREVTLVGQGVFSHHLAPFGAPKISRAQPCFLLHTLLVHLEREHSHMEVRCLPGALTPLLLSSLIREAAQLCGEPGFKSHLWWWVSYFPSHMKCE